MSKSTSNSGSPDGGDESLPKPYSAPFPSADTVKFTLEKAGATPEQITSALWLLDHGRTNKLPTFKALGSVIGRDATTVSKLFAGTYGADLAKLVSHIDKVRASLSERAGFGERMICETSVMRDVRTLCDLTRASQTMTTLFGKNQSGKSTALIEYTLRNNHGRTIFVRMPVGGSSKMFLSALLKACGISERNSYDQMRDRALKFFGYRAGQPRPDNSHLLLIVDEVHQAMIGRSVKTITMELIRELHDLCGIGVVLCGTDVLPEMIQDERFSRLLGQTANRGIISRRIPAAPSAADVKLVCRAYGFDVPEGKALKIVDKITAENGIGKLCGFLRMAKKLASNRHQTADWDHFLTTHATLAAWDRGDAEPPKKQLGNDAKPKQLDDEKGGAK